MKTGRTPVSGELNQNLLSNGSFMFGFECYWLEWSPFLNLVFSYPRTCEAVFCLPCFTGFLT